MEGEIMEMESILDILQNMLKGKSNSCIQRQCLFSKISMKIFPEKQLKDKQQTEKGKKYVFKNTLQFFIKEKLFFKIS